MLSAALLLAALTTPALFADELEQAQTLTNQGKLSAAAELLSATLAAGTGDERSLRLALADVRLQQHDSQQALRVLESLVPENDHAVSLALGRAHEQSIDVLFNQGVAQSEIDGAYDAAQTNLERAFDLRPDDDSSAVWELGKFYLYRMQWPDDATSLANEALNATPDDGEAFLLRGAASAFSYWNATQADDIDKANKIWQQAVDDLKKADELLPRQREEPLGQLVWFYEVQGISGKAVDSARSIADRSADPDLSLLYRLAVKYRIDKKYEASGRALEKIVEISARSLTDMIRAEADPTATAKRLTGSIDAFYRRGDKAACRSILSAIVASDPQDHGVWDTYAVICAETSRFDDAIAAYEQAIQIAPENPRTYNDLGALYQFTMQRDPDKSKELYEKCIEVADAQLAMESTPDRERSVANEARGLAQGNLNGLKPAGGGLLDSMMAGLRGLNLPSTDSDEGEGDEGESEGETEESSEEDSSAPR